MSLKWLLKDLLFPPALEHSNYKWILLKFFKWTTPCKHNILCRSGAQVQDHHWHWIGPIHQRTPSRWYKDQKTWRESGDSHVEGIYTTGRNESNGGTSLRAINLIKETRSWKLKGNTCLDGRPQRCYITKEDASLAIISLEALFTSLIIDAREGRDVAIYDVSGAYLNADIPEDKVILLNIEGEFVDIMCKVNPKHKKTVRVKNGVKVL